MRSWRTSLLVALVGGATAVVTSSVLMTTAQADIVSNRHYYANQTPYGDPPATTVKAPPAGYELVFLENLARHGARTLTNDGAEVRAYATWRAAAKQGRLTTRGQRFDNDLRAFRAVEQKIGYGKLSTVGKAEWRGIGRRTAVNYRDYLTAGAARGDQVLMKTSPIFRTKQSALHMRAGLTGEVKGLSVPDSSVSGDLIVSSAASSRGKAAIAAVERRSDVRASAKHLLRRIYTASYVNGLRDPVNAALDVYALYSTAPGLAGDTGVTFATYVPLADAKVLAVVVDARNFYRFGPGVAGETTSYRQARPVLDDFFSRLDDRLAGGTNGAVFRHSHGETMMAFAALIGAPGSAQQASPKAPFSYGNNPWRGFVAGRLAGNIEWAAYRNAGGAVLVTMRYNEQPVTFRSGCHASPAGAYFYPLAELKRCLR